MLARTDPWDAVLLGSFEWRKICFGNRSAKGGLATARLLTVTGTCQKQHRNALTYLIDAVIPAPPWPVCAVATAPGPSSPLNCYPELRCLLLLRLSDSGWGW